MSAEFIQDSSISFTQKQRHNSPLQRPNEGKSDA